MKKKLAPMITSKQSVGSSPILCSVLTFFAEALDQVGGVVFGFLSQLQPCLHFQFFINQSFVSLKAIRSFSAFNYSKHSVLSCAKNSQPQLLCRMEGKLYFYPTRQGARVSPFPLPPSHKSGDPAIEPAVT